jgi:general stress protein 26
MNTDQKEQKKPDALAFLKAHKTGVLATLSPEHTPHARLVYYASDDSFKIYFLTLSNTHKAEDISRDAHAAFVVATEEVPQELQMSGTIEDLTDSAILDPVVSELFANLKSNEMYGAPVTRFDAAKILFYCFTPSLIRWGDFTSGHTSDEVFTDIPTN